MSKNIKIGWARRDISTEKPINIPGQYYMRISEGVLDPIYATALTVGNDEDYVIFLSVDTGSIKDYFYREFLENVKNLCPEIDCDKILASATHTHAAPDTSDARAREVLSEGIKIASGEEYCHFAAMECAKAVCESFECRCNGAIGYGYGYAVVSHSRRTCYFDDLSLRNQKMGNERVSMAVDGHARMYGDPNDDKFSHYEAGADHFSNFMFTFDKNNKLTGAIVNIPCPSQNSEHEHMISSDYWNEVRQAISKEYGDIFILPQCAAAGDLSPRLLHYKKAQERRYRLKYKDLPINNKVLHPEEIYTRHDIAERVSKSFSEVLNWAKEDIKTEAEIVHRTENVNLLRRMVTEEEYEITKNEIFALENEKIPENISADEKLVIDSQRLACLKRCTNVIKRYDNQKKEPYLPMKMHVIKIGDIAFASNRFELYMDYQHRIQARSPFTQTFIVQLSAQETGGAGSYLPTKRAVEGRGYSAILYSNLVADEGGGQLVEKTVEILKEIY